jgi:hypothetical protein
MALKCGSIFLGEFSEGWKCGKKAVMMFDAGKRSGYPVCAECAKGCHPLRLSPLKAKAKSGD